ncbi:MAG: aminotransferase class III-fold pyridoxal phosphate-dependent enzyme [Alphaproteobacteria bacterium]|nr:aminotransferase class III-fold pyridoxal phosphate-dependent enzyme [Alphaproteobacteria bacterium]
MTTANKNSTGARAAASLIHGYGNLAALEEAPPLVIASGKGVRVFDEDGKSYIEGIAGMWCASFGFSEEAIIEAAIKQLRKMPYYHTLFDKTTTQAGELAEKLKALAPAPMSHVYFTNSGSEANDTIVKLVRYYNNAIGRPKKKKFIARHLGFHGLTLASASLTGVPVMHTDFDLPLPGFLHTALPHYWREGRPGESEEQFATRLADELEQLILREDPDTVAAFIAEPVMGAGGAVTPPRTYFDKVQAVLRKYDVLMVADEVICGFGRTGNMFGSHTYGIKPDLMSMAKGIASAYQPIAGVMISEKIYKAMVEQSRKIGMFAQAFTTSAHPVAVAVASKVVDLMAERDILGHVRKVSKTFLERLNGFAAHPLVGTTRGVGLIGAVELAADKTTKRKFPPIVKEAVRTLCQERGLIIRATGATDSLCFSPPLIINEAEINEMFDIFGKALDDVAARVEREGLRAA